MKLKLAILENDRSYLTRIMATFETRFADKFELYAFSDFDSALGVFNTTKVDVFLVSENIEIEKEKIPAACAFAYLTETTDVDSIKGVSAICKFQRADLIVKQIVAIYAEKAENSTGYKLNDMKAKVIAFTSFCGAGASSMAAACALHFSRAGKKALYLTFNPFGTAASFFHADGQFTFGDVIYAIKSGKANLAMKLEACVRQSSDGVFFFEAPQVALDMLELTPDDISRILSTLVLAGGYDYIVLDTEASLSSQMLALYHTATAMALVSDGSEICTAKICRFCDAFRIKDQECENPMADQLYLIYNKFSNKTGKADVSGLREIGGAPRFERATAKQVIEELSKMPLFDTF